MDFYLSRISWLSRYDKQAAIIGHGNDAENTQTMSSVRHAELSSADRVAMGCYQPTAPTDPYVRALAHTVPQFMASLRV